MYKRLATKRLKIGMFITPLGDRGYELGFPRTGFMIENPGLLARLQASGISSVIIDERRGRRAPIPRPAIPRSGSRPRPAPPPPVVRPVADYPTLDVLNTDPGPRRFRDECAAAVQTISRSKRQVAALFDDIRLGKAICLETLDPVIDDISASIDRNRVTLINLARLKRKDEYSYMHSVAVCALMINFARQLLMDEDEVRLAGLAGLLHDVGKMALPEALLTKNSALAGPERAAVRRHPEEGYALLSAREGVAASVAETCLQHHEKWDGTGYPMGLAGRSISLLARMTAICDVYDAITSDRPYKDRWAPSFALAEMMAWEGHFDPSLMPAFLRSLDLYPEGALVRLSNGQLGLILSGTDDAPPRLTVRAFFDTEDLAELPPRDVVIDVERGSNRILGLENPQFWKIEDWPRKRASLLNA